MYPAIVIPNPWTFLVSSTSNVFPSASFSTCVSCSLLTTKEKKTTLEMQSWSISPVVTGTDKRYYSSHPSQQATNS